MKRNIFGEIQFEAGDYTSFVLSELSSQSHYNITINEQTSHGFKTDLKIPNTGIYILYRNKQAIYVGCTETNIRQRIGRFIAAVRGTEHEDENHSAGYKYLEVFGNDLSDVTFKVCEIKKTDMPNYINLCDIEEEIINIVKPYFNNETYNSYIFEKTINIRSVK